MQETLRIGLENNYDIQITRNNERISDNNVTLGNAGFLPTANITSGYSVRNSNSDQFPRSGDDVISSRNSNTGAFDAGVSLSWSIFEGFRIQTNYKRLQELQTIGELNTRLAIEDLVANLTAEYYNYVHQQLRLNTLRQAVELSRERLRIVEIRYQVGNLSRYDLQQARVDFNADSSLFIQQQEALNSSGINLNRLMGIDVNKQFVTEDTTIYFNPFLSKDNLLESTMNNNVVLLLTEQNRVLSELELQTLESRNFPYLRLNTGYGFTHQDFSAGNFNRQRNWGPNVGVTVGYTLFDGFNRRREQQNQRIVIENRELEIERRILALQSDFANMWLSYQNNIDLTNLETESLENAKLNYEIAMDQYLVELISGFELRQAQISLLNAEQRLLTAQYRTKLFEISLLQISGRIGEVLD
ncbi:MAG: TolC family protein [Dysgonamonadaceae bacterium]|nr:TolC family protein [Dysgonamonadaceae bacterium]